MQKFGLSAIKPKIQINQTAVCFVQHGGFTLGDFMLTINVDLSSAIGQLDDLQKRQVPFAASLAINKTAQSVKRRLIDEMVNVFDRPTPYTLDGMYIKPSDKRNLTAEIGLKRDTFKGIPASRFLSSQIGGGTRSHKRFENALMKVGVLPKGFVALPVEETTPLDQYGNIQRGLIIELLAYFRAFGEQGYHANISNDKKTKMFENRIVKKRGKNFWKMKRGYRYFFIQPNQSHLAPGIYKRFRGGRKLLCLIKFVPQANYHKRFRFAEVGQHAVDVAWQAHFQAAIDYAIRTVR